MRPTRGVRVGWTRWWVAVVVAVPVGLSCGDSTGPELACDGAQNARLHFVNITDTPGFTVFATYAGMMCGPAELPVSTEAGLELAQLLIEGEIGDVIQVRAVGSSGSATANCQINDTADDGGFDSLQLFVNVSGNPVGISCAEGLTPV